MIRRALPLLVLVAGCSPPILPHAAPSPPPQTLRIAIGGAPASLDPALQRDPWERGLASFYTQPLLAPKPDLTDVAPGAATGYDVSPDGRTYTFHLRPDGRFSDGSAVTASDFVAAWRRLIDPRTASPHDDMFAAAVRGGAEAEALDPDDPKARIDQALAKVGVAAPDAATFRVVLARPAPWFKWLATVWAGAPSKVTATGIISNGPFAIDGQAEGVITLSRSRYFRPLPKLDRVLAYELGPGADALQLFRSGRLDIAPLDAAGVAAIAGDRRLRSDLRLTPQLTTGWLVFNTFQVPFGSADVRRAFSEALDRRAYTDQVLGGLGDPAFQLLPAGMPERVTDASALQRFDPGDARQLLAQQDRVAALPPVHLLVENTALGHAFGSFVAGQLKANLGVSITVDAVDEKAFGDRIVNRQFELAGPQRWSADYPDPQDWLDLFLTSSGANAGRWQDPLYDQLVGLADSAPDAQGRARAYAQAELELDAEAPATFLAQDVAATLVSPRVRGLEVTPFDPAPVLGSMRTVEISLAG